MNEATRCMNNVENTICVCLDLVLILFQQRVCKLNRLKFVYIEEQ